MSRNFAPQTSQATTPDEAGQADFSEPLRGRVIRLRRLAARQGLVLIKSRRRRHDAHDFGVYWLADSSTTALVCSQYGLNLDEVEDFLTSALTSN
jgi:hypothetical protein